TESGRKGDSVYLRGWDDYEHHTLKLTAAKTAGMGHFAFRTTSPEALERRAAVLDKAGFGVGWTDGDLGHGKTFARSPSVQPTPKPALSRTAARRSSAS